MQEGQQPDDEQSRLILWNVLDPGSKRIATSDKVTDIKYDAFVKWIDMRYKCAHGNLEYKTQGKDDPMGLALFAETGPYEPHLVPPTKPATELSAELDAFAKGKGKGKGDGRCHVCNG